MPSAESDPLLISLSRLIEKIAVDPDVRTLVRHFALAALAATEPNRSGGKGTAVLTGAGESSSGRTAGSGASTSLADQVIFPEESESPSSRRRGETATTAEADPYRFSLGDLKLGQLRPHAEPRPAPAERFAPVDFELIESRCRLKAEGARWAVKRRKMIADRLDFATQVEPHDRDLIARAKILPNCFLWLNHPSGHSSSDPARYEEVAVCFETLAAAVALVRAVEAEPDRDPAEFEAALNLLAEAQSMLRISVSRFDNYADTDQRDVFLWLKNTASEQQIFIRRFMRLDDPGDPALAVDLQERITALSESLLDARKKVKQHKKLLSKVKHKCALIQEQPEAALEFWKVLIPMIDELVAGGVPPSNRELREAVAPIVDSLPDAPELAELPQSVQLVLREIDRFLASAPAKPAEAVPSRPNPIVSEATKLLRGRSMVLIGGERRQEAEQSLIEAFQLKELHWISTREHESLDWFEPYVAKPDVAVVVLAIRWSSHSYGDVKIFCERHNKPLVRLPGGYNANQVAAQIMAQCSGKLQEAS